MLPILAIFSVVVGLPFWLGLLTPREGWTPDGVMALFSGVGVIVLAVDAMMARR